MSTQIQQTCVWLFVGFTEVYFMTWLVFLGQSTLVVTVGLAAIQIFNIPWWWIHPHCSLISLFQLRSWVCLNTHQSGPPETGGLHLDTNVWSTCVCVFPPFVSRVGRGGAGRSDISSELLRRLDDSFPRWGYTSHPQRTNSSSVLWTSVTD